VSHAGDVVKRNVDDWPTSAFGGDVSSTGLPDSEEFWNGLAYGDGGRSASNWQTRVHARRPRTAIGEEGGERVGRQMEGIARR
jgi:hypothetical protein